MDSGAIARFGGITAYGDEFHGTGFHLVGLTGWIETPDVRGEDVPRPANHGRFTLPMYLEDRAVGMTGFHVADAAARQWHDAARLRALILTTVTLTVESPFGVLWARGRVTEARYSPRGFVPEGDWRVTVECDDPCVYGETREFLGGQVAYHYGNFSATPRLMVGAGSGGYTITGPDGRLVVVGTAPAGAHYIDFVNSPPFTSDGVRQQGAITVYQPWTIAPGATVTASITGARTLAQRVTDTYV